MNSDSFEHNDAPEQALLDRDGQSSLQREGGVARAPMNRVGDERVNRMGTHSIPKLLAEFAVPAVVGMLVNSAYNLIDAAFLGNAIGEIGLSATQAAMPIMIVFMAVAMLIGNGGNAYAALKLGEGRRDLAERALGNTVTLSLIVWVVVVIVALIPACFDALLTISSATDEVRPYAAVFLRIVCFGYIFQCIGMGVNNFIRTAGAPNRALLTMVIGAVFCVIFNAIFVLAMGMGVAGSALATVLGQGVSCISVIWYFTKTKNVPMSLRRSNLALKSKVVGQIVLLGLASFFVQVGSAVLSFVTNWLLVKYGAISPIGADNALASIGLVMRIAMFTVMPLVGIAVAIQPLLGFNYGARLYGRVRKTWLWGILVSTVIAVLMWIAIQLWATPIVNAFGIRDQGLAEFTVFALKIQLMLLPIVGFQIVSSNYFQATGQPLKSTILSMSRQILFLLPLLIILPEVLPPIFPGISGLDAIYVATPCADALAIIVTSIVSSFEFRRLAKLISGKMTLP